MMARMKMKANMTPKMGRIMMAGLTPKPEGVGGEDECWRVG